MLIVRVYDKLTEDPIENAQIQLKNVVLLYEGTTNSTGEYEVDFGDMKLTLKVNVYVYQKGYKNFAQTFKIENGLVQMNVYLEKNTWEILFELNEK